MTPVHVLQCCNAAALSGQGAIVQNQDVCHGSGLFTTLPDMLQNDFWGARMNVSAHKSFRPLTTLSFRLSYVSSAAAMTLTLKLQPLLCMRSSV